jgi:hypothetical protein
LIVNGAVPLEVTVTDCEIAVPTETFPNARELALKLTAAVPVAGGESVMLKVCTLPPAWAVIVAV